MSTEPRGDMTYEQAMDLGPVRSVLLIELFEHDGRSARLYWAGKGNRIERNFEGVLSTFNPNRARQIPLAHRELAQGLADALNTGDNAFNTGTIWKVMDHGFYDG